MVDHGYSIEKCLEKSSPITLDFMNLPLFYYYILTTKWKISGNPYDLGNFSGIISSNDILLFTDDARFVLPADTVKNIF